MGLVGQKIISFYIPFYICFGALIQLGNIETVDFNNRLIETVDFNRFNKFQYRELTTEKLSKSVIVKNVKHGRHRFSFFFAQNGFLT